MTAKLVVGGAQLGSSYGIANATGAPGHESVRLILSQARDADVNWIDTARSYPGSEAAIAAVLREIDGWPVRVATKIPPLDGLPECGNNEPTAFAASIRHYLAESRSVLERTRLDAVLLHRWVDFRRLGSLLGKLLQEELAANRIGAFGVSVQTPEELKEALEEDVVQHIQLPGNLLDYRWGEMIPEIRRVRMTRVLRIHVRSLLLQGLLVSDEPDHWHRAYVASPNIVRRWLKDQVRACNRRSIQDLCFAWGRAQDWIDGIVVGAETPLQMAENLRDFATPPLQMSEVRQIEFTRPFLARETLNPAL